MRRGIAVRDAATGKLLWSKAYPQYVATPVYPRKGKTLAVGGKDLKDKMYVALLDAATGRKRRILRAKHDCLGHDLSPDGRLLAVIAFNLSFSLKGQRFGGALNANVHFRGRL